jgi:flagellar motor switch protein FliN/FliY
MDSDPAALDLLADVEMGVTAELGRCRMTMRELLAITPGAVIDLDRTAGAPVDVLVNGTLIARGEVVVVDEEFGIRISELVPQPVVAR